MAEINVLVCVRARTKSRQLPRSPLEGDSLWIFKNLQMAVVIIGCVRIQFIIMRASCHYAYLSQDRWVQIQSHNIQYDVA